MLMQRAPLLLEGCGRSPGLGRGGFSCPEAGQYPARRRKGAAGHFPPRKRTRWLCSCCSLFLFDLQRVWSPAGSLSWPQHCLITCSKGPAEEEAKRFPGREGLDEVGDVWTLSGIPSSSGMGDASMEPGCSQGTWNGCQLQAGMIPREEEVGMCIGCEWAGRGVGEPHNPFW